MMLSDFFSELWQILLELSPFLLLGLVFAGLLNGFVSKRQVEKHLGGSGFMAVLKASLLGVPLPLCSCGVIPTGIAFKKHGASDGSTVSFLVSTPQTGVDSILITYSMMNLPWAIFRPIAALITGVLSGLAVSSKGSYKRVEKTKNKIQEGSVQQKSLFDRVFKYAFVEFLQDISRPLVVGILLAVVFTLYIPDSLFTEYLKYPMLNMMVILLASIPLYICATGSVPIAAALLMKGLSPGAVLVFLMAGPATNMATMTVLWKSLGKRVTIIYVASIVLCSLAFGLVIDFLLPSSWFVFSGMQGIMDHQHHVLPLELEQISAVILVALLIFVELRKLIPKKTLEMAEEEERAYRIDGMTCNHCKANVERTLRELEGVNKAEVDLNAKSAIVSGNIQDDEVQKAVEGIGYRYKGLASS